MELSNNHIWFPQGSLNGDFANVEAGDCIVAFSRKDIFDVKVVLLTYINSIGPQCNWCHSDLLWKSCGS